MEVNDRMRQEGKKIQAVMMIYWGDGYVMTALCPRRVVVCRQMSVVNEGDEMLRMSIRISLFLPFPLHMQFWTSSSEHEVVCVSLPLFPSLLSNRDERPIERRTTQKPPFLPLSWEGRWREWKCTPCYQVGSVTHSKEEWEDLQTHSLLCR